MLELAHQLLPLLRAGQPIAVATSVDVFGSAPQALGTSMAVTGEGTVVGGVWGGCVESAALDACRRVLAGSSPLLERYGYGGMPHPAGGLACGGELAVVTHMLRGECVTEELAAAAAGAPAAVGVVTEGPPELLGRVVGTGPVAEGGPWDEALRLYGLTGERLRDAVRAAVASGPVLVECRATVRLFVEVARPAPLLALIGATDLAAALAAGARSLGYRVVVCDPRPAFATLERVPAAHEVVLALPHRWLRSLPIDARTVVCLLSHDDDLDPLALAEALDLRAGYVGALGSRATAARRAARLRTFGLEEEAIGRLHSPMGLDLGGRTAAETALSILAEVLATRTGSSAQPLYARPGPVHAAQPAAPLARAV